MRSRLTVIAAAVLGFGLSPSAHSAESIGIFETILESAIAESELQLHASHVVRVPDDAVSRPLEPMRTEKKYRKFNGNGPAKMMARQIWLLIRASIT